MSYDVGLFGEGRQDRSGGAILFRTLVFGGLVVGACLLAYLWSALLKYYRYEAHALRPIKDDTTAVPGNGSVKSEG